MAIDPRNYECPCCGKPMEYVTSEELYGCPDDRGHKYIVCKACDIKGRVREHNGFAFLVSVPAKRDTRTLRSEAHYFFNKLYEFGIFPDKAAAYGWLTECFGRKPGKKASQYHIGEMDNEKLKVTIKISIEKLAENPDKCAKAITPYNTYGGSYSSTNEYLSGMLKKLDETIVGVTA